MIHIGKSTPSSKPGHLVQLFHLLLPITLCLINASVTLAGTSAMHKTSLPYLDTLKRFGFNGIVTDSADGIALPFVTVTISETGKKTVSDQEGRFGFSLNVQSATLQLNCVGYQTMKVTMQSDHIQVFKMEKVRTALREVVVVSKKRPPYHNKGNPAVSLIQQIIDHKADNRMTSQAFLQYSQYERLRLVLTPLSDKFLHRRFFQPYQFLLDSMDNADGKKAPALPVFMSEKLYDIFTRSQPDKIVKILKKHKDVNLGALIDSAGLDIYLNRLYGNNIDIYQNNIFVLNHQFLSPIADHSPQFYKFFINDTIQNGQEKLIRLSFTPRTKGDFLFEGSLSVTMDGYFAIKEISLGVNSAINLNYVRGFSINQAFTRQQNGRYYLTKSVMNADFGIFQNKGAGIAGSRTLLFSNYVAGQAKAESFYAGKEERFPTLPEAELVLTDHDRPDTLPKAQNRIYSDFNKLSGMPTYRRTVWITKTLVGGYADTGPVQIGPTESVYSYNPVEGSRVTLGGRTTPQFNQNIYLEGYAAYGEEDEKLKYHLSTSYSFNHLPYYRYPNNFIRLGYQFDTDIPGQNFLISKTQSPLASIRRGTNNFWLYNRIVRAEYVKDFANHISFTAGFKKWDQRPADQLIFQPVLTSSRPVTTLSTTEANLQIRYAPHEQIFQGTMERHTLYNKYPIMSLQVGYGLKGILNGQYRYTNLSANIFKRFYLSQAGFSDITLLGGSVLGKVPFPLLAIMPANQTYLYERDGYNMMNFLEFVSDHYAGLNLTHHFNGFIFNKLPVIKHLQLREYLTFKFLYGGLRAENSPAINQGSYQFPSSGSGTALTYGLGNVPYMEVGLGVGNIFKFLRVDGIRRINYLDHPNVSRYGLRFSFIAEL